MTMIILGGDQRKAERIAHDLVKDLTVADVGAVVNESMGLAGETRLCTAVDEEFPKYKRRIDLLETTIEAALSDDIRTLFDEYAGLRTDESIVRQKADFALGYAAAQRLMKKKTANLKIAQPIQPEQPKRPSSEDLKREADSWRITRQEAARRVHCLRVDLEHYRDQLDAAVYDILCDGIPNSLDATRRWAVNVMRELNPRIEGLAKRCGSEEHEHSDDVFDMQLEISETAFAVGLLAGSLFSGSSEETVNRFERGLVHAMQANPQIVKA